VSLAFVHLAVFHVFHLTSTQINSEARSSAASASAELITPSAAAGAVHVQPTTK
jgi:hypothetical protein